MTPRPEVQVMLELLTKNTFESIMTENESKRQSIMEYMQMVKPSADTEYNMDDESSFNEFVNDIYITSCIDTLNIIMDEYEDIDVPSRKKTKKNDFPTDIDNLYRIMKSINYDSLCNIETLQNMHKDIDVRKYIEVLYPEIFKPIAGIKHCYGAPDIFELSSYGETVFDLLKRIKRDMEYDE